MRALPTTLIFSLVLLPLVQAGDKTYRLLDRVQKQMQETCTNVEAP